MRNSTIPRGPSLVLACALATATLFACAPVAGRTPGVDETPPSPTGPAPQSACGLTLNDLAGWRGYLDLAKVDPSASTTLAGYVRAGAALFPSWSGMDAAQVGDILTQEATDDAAAIRRELVVLGLNVASGRLNRATPVTIEGGTTTVGELISRLEQALVAGEPATALVAASLQLTQTPLPPDQVCARVVTVENDDTVIEKWWTPQGASQRVLMQLAQSPGASLQIAGLHPSPDLRHAIVETAGYDTGGPLYLLDLSDGAVVDLNAGVGLTVSASGTASAFDSLEIWQVVGWHPDGSRVLVTAECQDAVYWVDVDARTYERIALPDGGAVVTSDRSITLRPDGAAFAYVDGGGSSLWLYDMGDAAASLLYGPRENGAHIEYPSYSPDGGSIALLVESGDPLGSEFSLETLDLVTGELSLVAQGDLGLAPPLWSQDGRWLAFSRGSGSATDPCVAPDAPERFSFLWAFNAATEETRLVSTTGGNVRQAAWAPGGMALAYTVGIVDLAASPVDDRVQLWQAGEVVSLAVPGSAFFLP